MNAWLGLGLALLVAAGAASAAGPAADGGVGVPSAPQSGARYVDLVGQMGGATYAAAVQGTYAYVGAGPRLLVVDITNPAAPVQVGQTPVLPAVVGAVAVSSGYAFVSGWYDDTVWVVDVSDPGTPAVVGSYDAPERAAAVAAAGSTLYVAASYAGLRVVDVSDPARPVEVGFWDPTDLDPEEFIVVDGSTVYLAGDDGLHVIDAMDPTHPAEVGFLEKPYTAGLAVAGGLAYVGNFGGFWVVDVSDPAAPVQVGSWETESTLSGVAVSGSHVYAAGYLYSDGHFLGRLHVVDVSAPGLPVEAGACALLGNVQGVSAAGPYAYVPDGSLGLRIVDASDPLAPLEAGYFYPGGPVQDLAVAGRYAYTVDGWHDGGGLDIVDVSDPTAPALAGFHDTPGEALAVAVAGPYAFVADGGAGLRIVDVSDAAAPVEAGFFIVPGVAHDVAVPSSPPQAARPTAAQYAYVAYGESGLRILDVSDPTQPVQVGAVSNGRIMQHVVVEGAYAYLTFRIPGALPVYSGLQVVNVSDPAHPVLQGDVTWHGYTGAPDVERSLVYLGTNGGAPPGEPGFRIVDVSDAEQPVEVGWYYASGAEDVVVARGLAYVATGRMRVLDVSDPAHVVLRAYYDTPGIATGIALDEPTVYMGDGSGGLLLLRYAPPATAYLPIVRKGP